MAARVILFSALLLSCFLGFSHGGNILLSSLKKTLVVTASPKDGQVLKAGEDRIKVTWVVNATLPAGTDSNYKSIKVELCYAPVSQIDRAWRKTEDHLSKDKTCQFDIVSKPYNSADKSVQSFEWTVERDVPTATFFVRAYALNSAGDQVAYGETTDKGRKTNLFQIQSITGRHVSLDVAAACFSAFSVLSLFGFFVAEKRRKAKSTERQ